MEKLERLDKRWSDLEAKKSSLHERNEQYSRWTLPYLYPCEDNKDGDVPSSRNSVGARAVNHLSNKLVTTLFPAYRPFIKLEVSDEVREDLEYSDKDLLEQVHKSLVKGERRVIRRLDRMAHRTAATLACKYLIVTGNVLIEYPEGDGVCRVFSTRNYCVSRDLSGKVIEIMIKESKVFENLPKDVQTQLLISDKVKHKEYKDGTKVDLYTRIKLEQDGKYHVRQGADVIMLPTTGMYTKDKLPWVPLTWGLLTGEDYGRGMVEEHRGSFNAVDVLSIALIEGSIVASSIQFLVNPASNVDIERLNNAENGSYHSGRDGDIVAIKSDKHLDFQKVQETLDTYKRELAQIFLLNSAATRDAERVTAQEISYVANELETSYGGLYSRFTEEWQKPVADLMLARESIVVNERTIYPVVVTGLDTLSRMGDIDNFRMFVEDLSMVNGIPEEVRMYINVPGLMSWVGNNRGVDYGAFVKTKDEVQEEQLQAQQAQQQEDMMQSASNMAASAGTEIAKNVE